MPRSLGARAAPGAPDLWPGLARNVYRVHAVGEASADVAEGSKLPGTTIWAREAHESNFCAPGLYVAVSLHPREGGGTRVHVEWERRGTSAVGKPAVAMIRLTRGRPVAASIAKALRGLEQATGS